MLKEPSVKSNRRFDNRNAILRIRGLLAVLRTAHRPLTLTDLSNNLGLSRKTLERDLAFLIEDLQLPIVKITRTYPQGFYLTQNVCLCDLCSRPA